MDYSQGKIYKIYSTKTDKVYIGSTTKQLKDRLRTHRNNYQNYTRDKSYKSNVSVFQIFDEDRYPSIELICEYPCTNTLELRTKEHEIIKNTTANIVNKNSPIGKTKDELKEYGRQTYIKHKEQRLIPTQCTICGGRYSYYGKSAHLKTIRHLNLDTIL